MKIGVIARNYPAPARPSQGTFLYGLVQEFVALGAEVAVTSPQAVSVRPARGPVVRSGYGPESAHVERPPFVSCSVRRIGPLRLGRLTSRSFRRSARRGVPAVPDVFYGHFLFLGGDAAVDLGRRHGIPAVIALGESDITRYEDWLGLGYVSRVAAGAAGIVCVSPTLQEYCATVLRVPPERLLLAPNAVDSGKFLPPPREAARDRLGWPVDRPIVAFVGHFNDRKGPDRVLEAMRISRHEPLGIFLGSGPLRPVGPGVLHAGPVPHADVPLYLGASDVFVLPTLAEGSCNSILEALACGLPVISSDIPAIRDDVGDRPPVFLVDPRDVHELAARIDAVIDLESDSSAALRASARRMAEARDLRARAGLILDWLDPIRDALR
jgi:teichuronic acid biosynthesis glycosyltransferase TuaC